MESTTEQSGTTLPADLLASESKWQQLLADIRQGIEDVKKLRSYEGIAQLRVAQIERTILEIERDGKLARSNALTQIFSTFQDNRLFHISYPQKVKDLRGKIEILETSLGGLEAQRYIAKNEISALGIGKFSIIEKRRIEKHVESYWRFQAADLELQKKKLDTDLTDKMQRESASNADETSIRGLQTQLRAISDERVFAEKAVKFLAASNSVSALDSEIRGKLAELSVHRNAIQSLEADNKKISEQITACQERYRDKISGQISILNKIEYDVLVLKAEVKQADLIVGFERKRVEFDQSASEHRLMSRLINATLVISISIGVFVMYWLSHEATGEKWHEVLRFALSRIAILLFFGWMIKYLSALQSSHARQAVIYRDKRLALGIIQELISQFSSPSPTSEQSKILADLFIIISNNYLVFDKYSFHIGQDDSIIEPTALLEKTAQIVKATRSITQVAEPVIEELGKDKVKKA